MIFDEEKRIIDGEIKNDTKRSGTRLLLPRCHNYNVLIMKEKLVRIDTLIRNNIDTTYAQLAKLQCYELTIVS